MSAADIVQRWVSERDAAIEAHDKGLAHSDGQSIAVGSWNGSDTDARTLRIEAQALRFLARELDSDAEVEAAMAASMPIMYRREDAREAIEAHLAGDCGKDVADGILDALGWPT